MPPSARGWARTKLVSGISRSVCWAIDGPAEQRACSAAEDRAESAIATTGDFMTDQRADHGTDQRPVVPLSRRQ